MKPFTSFFSNEVESLFAQSQAGILTLLIIAFAVIICSLCRRFFPTLKEKSYQGRIRKITKEYTEGN